MPPSSRIMATFRASCSHRTASWFLSACEAKEVDAAARMKTRKSFFMSAPRGASEIMRQPRIACAALSGEQFEDSPRLKAGDSLEHGPPLRGGYVSLKL